MALRTGTGRGPGHLNRKSQGPGTVAPPPTGGQLDLSKAAQSGFTFFLGVM
jgi:hypothetical protein